MSLCSTGCPRQCLCTGSADIETTGSGGVLSSAGSAIEPVLLLCRFRYYAGSVLVRVFSAGTYRHRERPLLKLGTMLSFREWS